MATETTHKNNQNLHFAYISLITGLVGATVTFFSVFASFHILLFSVLYMLVATFVVVGLNVIGIPAGFLGRSKTIGKVGIVLNLFVLIACIGSLFYSFRVVDCMTWPGC